MVIEPLARAEVPIWIDCGVKFAQGKSIVIDRRVGFTRSANFTANAAENTENVVLISSEAVPDAYISHWQHRLVASVPYARREDWCRSPDVAGLKTECGPGHLIEVNDKRRSP